MRGPGGGILDKETAHTRDWGTNLPGILEQQRGSQWLEWNEQESCREAVITLGPDWGKGGN